MKQFANPLTFLLIVNKLKEIYTAMAKKSRTDEGDSTGRKKGSAGISTPPDMRTLTLLARARRSPVVKAARNALKRVDIISPGGSGGSSK